MSFEEYLAYLAVDARFTLAFRNFFFSKIKKQKVVNIHVSYFANSSFKFFFTSSTTVFFCRRRYCCNFSNLGFFIGATGAPGAADDVGVSEPLPPERGLLGVPEDPDPALAPVLTPPAALVVVVT